MKIKKLFETPKKAFISVIGILVILTVVAGVAACATNVIAKTLSIGEENAQNYAFADAGIDPVSAREVHTKFDFEHGNFVYEVEFIANGVEYEYLIKASDGSVLKKEMETKFSVTDTDNKNDTVKTQITLKEAEDKALADAGLTASDVTFTKEKQDYEDGITVYEIEFYTSTHEYEYEINAETGNVCSRSKKLLENMNDSQLGNNSGTASENNSGNNPGNVPVVNPGNSENQENTGNSTGSQANASNPSNPSNPGNTAAGISIDDAKKVALADAGLTVSGVAFTKEKQDYENGIAVYEIEFYTSTHEYEYEINAVTGAILSRDIEVHKNTVNNGNTAGSHDNHYNHDDHDGYDNHYNHDNHDNHGNYGNTGNYIGADEALSIALRHAGFSLADVSVKESKLDNSHGQIVYEIEFYKNGREYEYKINATTGEIVKYEID